MILDKVALEEEITEALRTVIDPEIGLNVVELGLIRGMEISDDKDVKLTMIPGDGKAAKSKVAKGVNPEWTDSKKNTLQVYYDGDSSEEPRLLVQCYDAEVTRKDRIIGSGVIATRRVRPRASISSSMAAPDRAASSM